MRVLVVAAGVRPEAEALCRHQSSVMLPMGDRPLLQHVVEFLADRGHRRLEFVFSHLPLPAEDLLGDGTRWGASFRFHLARSPEQPYAGLRALPFEAEETVLLACGDTLPRFEPGDLEEGPPVLFTLPDGTWSGWARLPAEVLAQEATSWSEEQLFEALRERLEAAPRPLWLGARSYREYLDTSQEALGQGFEGLLTGGREVEPGIWLGRNVSLHPSARLDAPVYLGTDTQVGPGVRLGPGALVGARSILDRRTVLARSMVLPGSYLGEELELEGAIVDRNLLVSVPLGATVPITDSFLLGSTAARAGWASSLVSRGVALVLLVVGAPLLLLAALAARVTGGGDLVRRRRVLRLPAGPDEPTWSTLEIMSFETPDPHSPPDRLRHFLFHFLPGLWQALRGEVRVVGAPLRTPEEARVLPEDWKAVYLSCPGGLVTESLVEFGARADADQRFCAEACYAARQGVVRDLQILGAYLLRVVGLR